jgi:hypothetical protein
MAPPGISPCHTCEHCATFTLYLYDSPGERWSKPTWNRPNPTHDRLSIRLFGESWWAEERRDYCETFYVAVDGISLLEASHDDLLRFSHDGCLFAQRFIDCLKFEMSRDLECYVMGIKLVSADKAELGIICLDMSRWSEYLWTAIKGPERHYTKPPEVGCIYSVLAERGQSKCIERESGS